MARIEIATTTTSALKMAAIAAMKNFSSRVRTPMSWGPSPEYADWWYVVSWRGIIWAGVTTALAASAVVIFTALQFWSDGIRDRRSDARQRALEAETASAKAGAARANERAAGLEKEAAGLKAQAEADRLARLKIEARLAPRSITQQQQHELTAKLSEFKDVRGTVVALPSTPESEMFARVLTAPLKAAGWSIAIVAGERDGMMLHPKGVIVQYPMDLATSTVVKDGQLLAPPGPWNPLVDALNEFGIAASAIPWPMQAPDNIGIIISER